MDIIDCHAHIGKGEFLRDIFQLDCTPEKVEKLADQAGIHKTVIFPVRYSDYDLPNQEIARLAQSNKKFIGFARVNGASEKAPGQIKQAICKLGLKGVKIHTGEGFPSRETMDVINSLKVPVLFHSGMGVSPLSFEGIARSYPDLPIILAHIGTELDWARMFSSPLEAIWMAENFKNVYLDTSSIYIQANLERAVSKLGADKIIFGTDSPWFHPSVELCRINCLEISDSEKAKILGLNIAQLLKL